MYITDTFAFIELQKTGTTHITEFLSKTFSGTKRGKHAPAPPELLASGRKFLGSIRNPWDWHISLWAYGCEKRGALYEKLTAPDAPKSAAWSDTYKDQQDPECFRRWIKLLYPPKSLAGTKGAFSNKLIGSHAGLLTFRYFKIFAPPDLLDEALNCASPEELHAFDEKHCYIDFFIKNENLEEDLSRGLSTVGHELSTEQYNRLLSSGRTNATSRRKGASFYYDQETTDLVARREQFIIDKFDYSSHAPHLVATAALR